MSISTTQTSFVKREPSRSPELAPVPPTSTSNVNIKREESPGVLPPSPSRSLPLRFAARFEDDLQERMHDIHPRDNDDEQQFRPPARLLNNEARLEEVMDAFIANHPDGSFARTMMGLLKVKTLNAALDFINDLQGFRDLFNEQVRENPVIMTAFLQRLQQSTVEDFHAPGADSGEEEGEEEREEEEDNDNLDLERELFGDNSGDEEEPQDLRFAREGYLNRPNVYVDDVQRPDYYADNVQRIQGRYADNVQRIQGHYVGDVQRPIVYVEDFQRPVAYVGDVRRPVTNELGAIVNHFDVFGLIFLAHIVTVLLVLLGLVSFRLSSWLLRHHAEIAFRLGLDRWWSELMRDIERIRDLMRLVLVAPRV